METSPPITRIASAGRWRLFTSSRTGSRRRSWPDWLGIVHGDIYWANLHFNEHGDITMFDFDLCGYGWRAYDLAYYYTRVPEAVRGPALDGYESLRPLADSERDMLSTFGGLAWIHADGRPVSRLARLVRNPYV